MKQIYVTMTTWHGLLWLCLRQHPSEASVKICSGWFREDLVLVWLGLEQYPSKDSVKVSSRSYLFWLF